MTVDGVVYEVEVEVAEESRPRLGAVFTGGAFVPQHAETPAETTAPTDSEGVTAPVAGTVARIPVKVGQEIAEGDVLVVVEAMKMETEITAAFACEVTAVLVAVGEAVTAGQALVQVSAVA